MTQMIELKKRASFTLFPIAPFNFDATVFKPDHFPTPDHIWEKGKYWQTMRVDNKVIGFKLENQGTIKKPKVKITLYTEKSLSPKEKQEVVNKISYQFGFNEDLNEFFKKFRNDKLLDPSFRKLLGMRVNSGEIGLYTMLMVYIVLQNATVRRTVQMMNALLENYGKKVKFDGKEIYVFWIPEILNKASEEELRNLKVGYRAKFFKRVSADFVQGKIDEEIIKKLPKGEAKKEMLKIYGIGPVSVDSILFEVFRYYDAFDVLPPWDQKILSRLIYNKPLVSAKKILKDAEKRWGKWKRLAIHYIWEDVFWKRKTQHIYWLEKEIRL